MNSRKVVIIGAGPAGLSCGYELVRAGYQVEIFEATRHVGGMARTFDLWGQKVDLGPHRFFSKERHVFEFYNSLIGKDSVLVNRITRIYYRNRFFHYPIRLLNVMENLPVTTLFSILWEYCRVKIFPIRRPKTFEEWVTNRFGRKLFEIFFRHYSEKLWGIPCSRIDADWAAQRIKSLSLWEALIHALTGDKNKKHKTLLDQFSYPKYGTGMLYERAADFIRANGGAIYFASPVKRIIQDETGKACSVLLADGTTRLADFIVSTMPVTDLIKGIDNVPDDVVGAALKLYFRNTILVYLEVESSDLFPDNWVYVHAPEVKHGRITNFRNWSSELYGAKTTTILCMEFWAFDDDQLWKDDETTIASLATREIRTLGLIPENTTVSRSHVVRVPRCYPVYETGYREHLGKVEGWLDRVKNLIPIGRYGAFKYNNQDHSILMGILAAEKISQDAEIDLWKVNTDIEYQETEKVKDVLIG
jgi:protoporphyrinogen oxidase